MCKTFSATPASRRRNRAEQRAEPEDRRNADPDDGTVLFGLSAGVKQGDESVRRSRRPQVEQRRVLRDRARDRPNAEGTQAELTDDVGSCEQIRAEAGNQRQDLRNRPDLERLYPDDSSRIVGMGLG